MLIRSVAVAALSLSLFGSPGLARAETSGNGVAPNHNVGDPNERICENITSIGSRIATKRFCGTRAEWADRKRQDREALERAQLSPCVMTHNVRGANGNGAQSC
jgi:hypothetical protein